MIANRGRIARGSRAALLLTACLAACAVGCADDDEPGGASGGDDATDMDGSTGDASDAGVSADAAADGDTDDTTVTDTGGDLGPDTTVGPDATDASHSDAHDAGPDADDVGPDADDAGVRPDVPLPTFETSEEACRAHAAAFCEHVDDDACVETSQPIRDSIESMRNYDTCDEAYVAITCGRWLGAEARSYAAVDLDNAAGCVQWLQSRSCADYFAQAPERGPTHPCATILDGNQNDTDPCFNDADCVGELICVASSPPRFGVGPIETQGLPGYCRVRGGVGEECTSTADCEEGLVCDFSTISCVESTD